MAAETPVTESPRDSTKKPYQKPELIRHGMLGELTQSGGFEQHDGVFSRKIS